jgi:hypothetical protein
MPELRPAVVPPQHRFALRWSILVPAAVVSLVTMPVTAIWFLLLAPIVGFLGATAAALARSSSTKDHLVSSAAALSIGLLVGPIVYLALAF